jgi:hypothetical protein
MKNKRNVFVITVVITVLLVLLCGCAETNNSNSKKNVTETNENNANMIEVDEVEMGETENQDEVTLIEVAPIIIKNIESGNYKDEIINQINIAKMMSDKEHEEYGNYLYNEIPQMQEFYFPPKIEGYELYCVSIGKYGIEYYFAPEFPSEKNLDVNGEYSFSYDSGILMVIDRPNSPILNVTDPLKSIVSDNYGYILTEDNLAYNENGKFIVAQIGNTLIDITVPDELNKYEFLRELCFEIIKTSELVVVGE